MYIEREKSVDMVIIDVDEDDYTGELETNDLFTFGNCISNQDIALEHEVNIGTYHTIEFEVSNVNFIHFKMCDNGSNNYILVESDSIDYACGGEAVSFTGVTLTELSKIKLVRNNLMITCYVDNVLIDSQYLLTNSEYKFINLITTLISLPIIETVSISNIGINTATSGGTIVYDGGGGITSKGVCWSTSSNPTIVNSHTSDGSGSSSYVSSMTGLSINTLYHVRAYATNSEGTVYGEDVTFTTSNYTTIKYGLMYNGFTALDSRHIAPTGWHIPSNAEWDTLVTALGSSAGGKLKETGTTYWNSPNTGAVNSVLFNGRGGGQRDVYSGAFSEKNQTGYYWTSEAGGDLYWLNYSSADIQSGFGEDNPHNKGASIRCIKDDSTNLGYVEDIDGNVYPTIKVGSQVWMAQNLRTTKYRNGGTVPLITSNSSWIATSSGARCSYDNDDNNI
ncbi:MAG: hypothetical protein LLF83_03440 [Methanobacterium sp.]|nr:hypothetical protein [Methanobacterium sp.]